MNQGKIRADYSMPITFPPLQYTRAVLAHVQQLKYTSGVHCYNASGMEVSGIYVQLIFLPLIMLKLTSNIKRRKGKGRQTLYKFSCFIFPTQHDDRNKLPLESLTIQAIVLKSGFGFDVSRVHMVRTVLLFRKLFFGDDKSCRARVQLVLYIKTLTFCEVSSDASHRNSSLAFSTPKTPF